MQLIKELKLDDLNMHNLIEILKQLFKSVSEKTDTVSSVFDIAIMNSEVSGMATVN